MILNNFDLIELAIFAADCAWLWLLSMAASLVLMFSYMQAGQTLHMFCALQGAMMSGVAYAKVRDWQEGTL